VRKELRDSDAKQVAKTLSRDLVYPIALLNGLVTNWERCPRFKFDLQEPEDLKYYADALPKLTELGIQVPRQWAQERLGIPEPEGGEDVLQPPQKAPAPVAEPATKTAAATAQQGALTAADRLDDHLQPATATWIEQIRQLVERADSLEQIRDGLANLLPGMSIEQYAEGMAQALAAAALQGRLDIIEEAARGR